MCGIAGFVGRGALADLRRMNAAQRHRGPDGEGTYVDSEFAVYLGHQRLAVLDIEGGHQPMWTADGTLGIVFNGEIYNHGELRRELRALGAQFTTDHSDTEVLLHAYRHWGDGFVDRLNGMWAFVIYDRPRRRLFGSRDRFGKKPFYYTHGSDCFAFASELTALRAHPSTPTTVSRLALKKYFAYGYIPAPHCYLEGVSKLPAGHSFAYDLREARVRTWRHWEFRLEPDPALDKADENTLGEELLGLLKEAVRCRLVADVPIGTFLSGGIDSSTVTALAAQCLPANRLETFSIGFDEASFDESSYAATVARQVGSRHHHHVFSENEAQSSLPRIVAGMDEPMGDSSIMPTWFLCQHARRYVTVALGGDGADELFAGYDPFRALRWASLYQSVVPRPVHRAIALLAGHLPVSHRNMSLDFKLKRSLRGMDYPPPLWCPVWMAPLPPEELAALFDEPVETEDIYAEAIACWDRQDGLDLVARTTNFYVNLYLQDDILTKIDRASMAHSLEVRAPFLDRAVVDFARRLPSRYRLEGNTTKALLKRAVEHLLPAEIVHRPKKGFGVPIGRWFQSGLLPLPTSMPSGLNLEYLKIRALAHQTGRADERALLWNALLLQAPPTRSD